MIYNKPHDISWKLLPSLRFSADEKTKKKTKKTAENLINQKRDQGASIPLTDINTEIIFDINAMPVIEGVPILQFPPKPIETESADTQTKTIAPPPYIEAQGKLQKEKKAKKKDQADEYKPAKRTQALKIASFFITLYIGTVFAFIIPLRPVYSESEKRDLASFPKLSAKAFFSGDYFNDIDTWFSDTFPYRDFFTGLDGRLRELYGINNIKIHGDIEKGDEIPDTPVTEKETQAIPDTTIPQTTQQPTTQPPKRPDIAMQDLGAIIVAGDSGYEYYSFSSSLGARYVAGINSIKDKAKPTNNVYSLIVPTSIDVTLDDMLRKEVKSSDQRKALAFFNSSISTAIPVNNLLDKERQHRDEYIYFRTDHHWTALGAYYAYEEFCLTKGIQPIPLSSYEAITYKNFTGTFYTNAAHSTTLKENADYVTAYLPFNNNTCTINGMDGTVFDIDLVRDVSGFGNTLKYLTFIGGDNPLTTIKNLDNPNGETCIVIKDSYGNAFVPFLLPHYSTIYVIDPRYYNGSLATFTEDKTINDVIFISNISTTRNSVFIESLENLVK